MKTDSTLMLWELIGRLAKTCLTFRLSGESGVGKEAIASLIFRHYPHKEAEFVRINCEALPVPNDTEGITGAHQATTDKFHAFLAAPEKRALYLDNIHRMPIEAQLQLLQMMERQCTNGEPWIFSASSEPIESMPDSRIDPNLVTALNTVHIAVPPLRSHAGKIPQILSWYMSTYTKAHPDAVPMMPGSQTMDFLLKYAWPGNLRQLQEVAWNAFASSDWDAAVALLDNAPLNNNGKHVDELAAIYLMSLAKLSIQREKVIECLMTASNKEDVGLLDLAIYNEAVSQIADHIETTDAYDRAQNEGE